MIRGAMNSSSSTPEPLPSSSKIGAASPAPQSWAKVGLTSLS